jgi:hypothetical protein
MDMLEVQTPFLDADAAEALLGPADNLDDKKQEEVISREQNHAEVISANKENYKAQKE